MISTLIGLALRNPLATALAFVAALFAASAGWQYLRAAALEVKLSRAEATVSSLRADVAIYHAESEALVEAVGEMRDEVERFERVGRERSEAAARELEAARERSVEAEARIEALDVPPGADCAEAVARVREVWEL